MKGSDNPFPSILIEDGGPPAPPTLGGWYRLFVQGEQIKLVDYTGTVYNPTDFIQEMVSDVADDVAALSVVVDGKAAYAHTQSASTITDLAEAVQDIVGASLVGSGVTVSYNDAAGTVTITGLATTDAEAVRDAIGIAIVGVGSITVTVDDAADTITIGSAVPSPTGQADGKVLQTSGGALVYAPPPSGGLDLEAMQDAVNAMFVDTASVTKAYDDTAGTIALTAAGGGGGGATARVPYTFTDTRATLTMGTGQMKVPNATGRTLTLLPVRVDLVTAPTGSPLVVDVNKNGTTIFTTQSGRPSVAAGALFDVSDAPDVTSWAPGETLTIDVDAVGTTTPGNGLTVTIIAEG